MPGYKAHLAGGTVSGGLILIGVSWKGIYNPDPVTGSALLAICLMGSLFPDADTDSKGQNIFYSLLLAMDLALMSMGFFKWAAIVGFCAMLPAIGHHRGWTHTWFAMLIVPLPIVILPVLFYDISIQFLAPYYIAAVTGYFSHLLLDRKFK